MGLIVLGLVFVVDRLGSVYELTLAIYAIIGGALIGLFTVGMLCRHVNTKVIYWICKYAEIFEIIRVGNLIYFSHRVPFVELSPHVRWYYL